MVARPVRRVISARASVPAGTAGDVLLGLRKRHPRLIIQMVAMNRLPAEQAVAMIGEQTLRAARTGALLAEKPEVDLLLRLAGTTQNLSRHREDRIQIRGHDGPGGRRVV